MQLNTWFDVGTMILAMTVPMFAFVTFWASLVIGVIFTLRDKKTSVSWVGMTATAAVLVWWCYYVAT